MCRADYEKYSDKKFWVQFITCPNFGLDLIDLDKLKLDIEEKKDVVFSTLLTLKVLAKDTKVVTKACNNAF